MRSAATGSTRCCCPTAWWAPAGSGERRVDGTNSLASHAGLPSVVVPAGHTEAGLPIAAQLIARPYAETALLQLAHLLDQAAGAVKLPAATPALPGEGY